MCYQQRGSARARARRPCASTASRQRHAHSSLPSPLFLSSQHPDCCRGGYRLPPHISALPRHTQDTHRTQDTGQRPQPARPRLHLRGPRAYAYAPATETATAAEGAVVARSNKLVDIRVAYIHIPPSNTTYSISSQLTMPSAALSYDRTIARSAHRTRASLPWCNVALADIRTLCCGALQRPSG